jgi:hypothetical protein
MDRTGLRQPSGPLAAHSASPGPGASRSSAPGSVQITAAVSLCLLVAGCAGAHAGHDAVGWVAPGEEHLSLVAAARPDRWRAVRYTDEWQAEEYARASSAGLRLEYLYVTADPGSPASLDLSFDPVRAVGLFRHNHKVEASAWGGLGRVNRPGGTLLYRPYRLGTEACFGFEGDLDWGGEDTQGQPSKLLLGYGCSNAGVLSAARIEAILDGIGTRRAITSAALPSLPSAETALDFAHGKPEADQGLVSFPLRLAQHYALADADEVW